MQIKELLESQGGVSKRWMVQQQTPNQPTIFTDAQENPYILTNVTVFPLALKPITKTPLKLPQDQLLNQIESTCGMLQINPKSIKYVNAPTRAELAGALVIVTDAKKKKHAFFKYFAARKPDEQGIYWSMTDFKNDTGIEWQQQRVSGTGPTKTKVAIKQLAVKPSNFPDLVTGSSVAPKAVPDIVYNTILDTTKNQELAEKLKILTLNTAVGKTTPVPGLGVYEHSLRVNFGEVVSPLALISGKLVGGQYQRVETDLLAPMGLSWKGAKAISYPKGNERLFDSIIYWPDGTDLKISNKAEGKGGAASTTSLYKTYLDYPERFASRADKLKLSGKYAIFMDVLAIAYKNKSLMGMLEIAEYLKLISGKEKTWIYDYVQSGSNNAKLLSPKLIKIRDQVTPKPGTQGVKAAYHLSSGLANLVVRTLNKDKNLVSEFFKFMLSKANLVQVDQYTQKQGDGLAFSQFNVQWPPHFPKSVLFDASDFQTNKAPGAKLAFKT